MTRHHVLVGTALCVGLLAAGGFALQSQSANFTAQPQALTSGGGGAASASYVAPQQALGPLAGSLSSASYSTTVGVVQHLAPEEPPVTSVGDWQDLHH